MAAASFVSPDSTVRQEVIHEHLNPTLNWPSWAFHMEENMEAFLEAFPFVGLLLASTLVLLAAEIVKSATQWVKTRLKQRLLDVPHVLTHLVSFTFSLALGFAFLHDGRLTDDPVLGALHWPWNVLIFSVAVFLRAGGVFDTQRENTQELARHRQ